MFDFNPSELTFVFRWEEGDEKTYQAGHLSYRLPRGQEEKLADQLEVIVQDKCRDESDPPGFLERNIFTHRHDSNFYESSYICPAKLRYNKKDKLVLFDFLTTGGKLTHMTSLMDCPRKQKIHRGDGGIWHWHSLEELQDKLAKQKLLLKLPEFPALRGSDFAYTTFLAPTQTPL